jgi:molecular chaperone DnaK
VSAEEKAAIDQAVEALKEAVKTDDKDDIEAKTNALTELSGKLAERVYAQHAGADAGGAHDHAGGSTHAADDGVIDADFEEVKK